MSTAVLILPTGTYRADDFIEAGRSLGVDLVIASEKRHASMSSEGFIHIDSRDLHRSAEAIVQAGDRRPINAVIPVDDAGAMIAAIASQGLGLAHNHPASVAATRNKAILRNVLNEHEVPQPTFELAAPSSDTVALAEVVGTPVVLKPLSLSGSRGVIRVDHPLQVPPVVERIRRILAVAGQNPNELVLIERYIPGREIVLEGLLVEGALRVLALFDKPEPMDGPYFAETMLVTPSRLHPEILEEVETVATRAVRALGLREGPIHAKLRIHGSRVAIIEVAARSIGGLRGRSLHFGLLGTTLEDLLLRHALGMRVNTHREDIASGVLAVPVPSAGTLRTVNGLDAARAVPGITEVAVTIPPGTYVIPLPDGARHLGFLFARAGTPLEVETSLAAARNELEIVIIAD
ncbi:MAG: ATP-grasp domain-containing protein [Gammaproteobacteria bacterium]|nr:ATP-grasp domain-containing protein [Gammaproteobacteria bacterium]